MKKKQNKPTADKSDKTTGRKTSNSFGKIKETQNRNGIESSNSNKTVPSQINETKIINESVNAKCTWTGE